MEGKKFLSSDLISEMLLLAHGLSILVEDLDDWIIDEYGSPDSQPGKHFSFMFF